MSDIIVAAFIWSVALCATFSRTRGGDRSVSVAAFTIAISLTLNIDPLYTVLDRYLGGTNLAELTSDLLLLVGVSFLMWGVVRATRPQPGVRLTCAAVAVMVLFCAAAAAAFTFIAAPTTSTHFMLAYGDQPAAAIYSILQFTYVGAAVIIMGSVALKHADEFTHAAARASLRLIAVGCLCALLLAATIIAMDLAHISGATTVMHALSVVYLPLYVGSMVLLCVGFAVLPLSHKLETLQRSRRAKQLVRALTPAWSRALNATDPIPVEEYTNSGGQSFSSPELVLHRMVVEVRDAIATTGTPLSPATERDLNRAEEHLLGRPLNGKVKAP